MTVTATLNVMPHVGTVGLRVICVSSRLGRGVGVGVNVGGIGGVIFGRLAKLPVVVTTEGEIQPFTPLGS